MPIELKYLVASVIIFAVMIAFQALSGIIYQGVIPLIGSRDSLKDDTVLIKRAKRANQNMIEALVLFTPLVLVAAQTNNLNATTALGATLFFWGRAAFAPLYWMGVAWLRTIVWFVSVIGLLMILSQVLPF